MQYITLCRHCAGNATPAIPHSMRGKCERCGTVMAVWIFERERNHERCCALFGQRPYVNNGRCQFYPNRFWAVDSIDYTQTTELMEIAAMESRILESRVILCDKDHNLQVDLPCIMGIIPFDESGFQDCADNVKLVGKSVKFVVRGFWPHNGERTAILSRKDALAALEKEGGE